MLINKIKCCLCLVFCIFSLTIQASHSQPYAPYYSQSGQDKYVIENIFKFKKNGTFIDIGAHDGISYSNTYFLEKYLNWHGICIEPQPQQFQSLKNNRNCICIEGCIFKNNGAADFVLVTGYANMLSGLLETYKSCHMQRAEQELIKHGGMKELISVNTFNLNDLCKHYNITHVDFLSIDTEGSEEEIIKSIDFDSLYIHVIAVEHNYKSGALYHHLISHGYRYACRLEGDEIYINQRPAPQLLHYYCIPSDAKHYTLLKNLIGSIHYADYEKLGEIAVFDLGLNTNQRQELVTMQKVSVHDVEMTNPHLLTYFPTDSSGRHVRGFFAWKPVIIKQALELFPYILYLDAGSTVLKPLDPIFECIQQQGYFLVSCTPSAHCNIANRITKKVMRLLVNPLSPELQKHILDENTIQIDAGMQGLSRQLLHNYVFPLYESSKNLKLFEDDGSAQLGYGAGRHDQILFSIYAHCLSLTLFPEGYFDLKVNSGIKKIHTHWDPQEVNADTYIYRSRWDTSYQGGKTPYIQYK